MADDNKLRFGDDLRLYLDTANNWTSPVWVEVKCADELSGDRGIISAAFNCRGEPEIGHRRSLRRDPSMTLSLYVKPGDAAYEAVMAAVEDQTNGGTEILHLAIVDGDITVAGNDIRENDFVAVTASDELPTGEAAMVEVELRRAVDSFNAATTGTTS